MAEVAFIMEPSSHRRRTTNRQKEPFEQVPFGKWLGQETEGARRERAGTRRLIRLAANEDNGNDAAGGGQVPGTARKPRADAKTCACTPTDLSRPATSHRT